MQKILLSTALAFLALNANAQFSNIHHSETVNKILQEQKGANKTTATLWRLKSAATYGNNGTGMEQQDSSVYIYSGDKGSAPDPDETMYDDYGIGSLVKADTCYKYVNNNGDFNLQEIYASEYDAQKRRTRFMVKSSSSSLPPINDNDTYVTYDNNGNVIKEITLDWNSTASKWDTTGIIYTTYNSSNKPVTDSTYNPTTKSPTTKSTYSYDGSGNQIATLTEAWGSGSWSPVMRDSMLYDGSGKLLRHISQIRTQGNWRNSYLDSLGYNNTTFYTYNEYREWDTTKKEWVNSERSIKTVNSKGLPSMFSGASWDTSSKTWVNQFDAEIKYNAQDLPTQGDIYIYISGFKMPNPFGHLYYYYEHYFPVSVASTNKIENNLVVYPNPATDVVNINNADKSLDQIELFDINGRKVRSIAPSNTKVSINISDLSSGIYVLKGHYNTGNESTQTIVIQ